MAITFLEPGGDATFTLGVPTGATAGFWYQITGASTSSTFVHGGHLRSLLIPSSIAGSNYLIPKIGTCSDSGSRCSFYFLTNTIPNGNLKINPIEIVQTSLVTCFGVTLNTTGKLAIYDSALAIQATGTSTLSTSTWYRISVAYTITNAGVNSIKVFLNGVLEVSATNITVTTSSSTSAFGFTETIYGATGVSIYYSDFYIDNSASLTDTGNIWVTAKRPNTNGTTNGFTTQIGSGGSGYGSGHSPQVNERAASTTNGWSMVGAGSAITEEYNIEGTATGDINISTATIVDYVGWVWANSLINSTGSLIVNGVGSSIALTNSGELFYKVAGSNTYPAGTGADIGIVTSTTLTTVSLYECGILVAYIPASSISATNFFF